MDQLNKMAARQTVLWFVLFNAITFVEAAAKSELSIDKVAGLLIGNMVGAPLFYVWTRHSLRKS